MCNQRCCSICCAVWSFCGAILMTLLGIMIHMEVMAFQVHPKILEHSEGHAANCWWTAMMYAITFVMSVAGIMYTNKKKAAAEIAEQ
eukprot:TRINITY_DN2884_c0_g1_i1.p1 TRINITY_DN2884_c0_g1~~TRINITY_DN2884_c0_g1_i1.p1  ORF type:complete len:87 (+),score=0.77 TRINITY_DN2884_c0_g1_i1:98-358(+)